MQALNLQWFHWWHAGAAPDAWALSLARLCAQQIGVAVAVLWLAGVLLGGPVWRRQLLQGLLAVLLGGLIALAIYRLWPQPRPFMVGLGPLWQPHAARPGLPSGHATALLALTASLGLQGRWRVALPLGLAAALVGWGRVYLGVHFPFDILAALPVGLLAAVLARLGWRWLPPACQVTARVAADGAVEGAAAAAHTTVTPPR